MGNARGFTLVELVLTIGVLAVLGLAAVPYLSNVGTVKAEAAADKLVSDLTYARRLARNRNGIYGVSFDAVADSYTVYLLDPSSGTETPVVDPARRGQMIVDLTLYPGLAGVDIQSPSFGGTPEVRFTPEGIPQNGSGAGLAASGSVQLVEGGVSRTVSVQAGTGEVSRL